MQRILWIACLPLLLGALLAAPPQIAQGQASHVPFVSGEVIVKLRPGVSPRALAVSSGLSSAPRKIDRIPGEAIYRFKLTDGTSPADKAAALDANPLVLDAEPNYLGQVPEARQRSSWAVGQGAGDYLGQWAPAQIGLSEAHAQSRGAGVTVAILDTGVDLAHPALAGRLVPGYDFVAMDDTPQEEEGDGPGSAFGHGTHVAGLVALSAPEASIMPLRTLGPEGTGDLWSQMLALSYAAASGADVINLSFSFGERSKIFDDMVAELSCTTAGYADCRSAQRPGAIIVTAAGNSGANVREWPGASAAPGMVTVGASTELDTLADFSTYGAWVPLAAPGENIVSCVPYGGYAAWSGTSMATPLVSGVAALVRSSASGLRPAEVARRLVLSADTLEGPVRLRLDAATAVKGRLP